MNDLDYYDDSIFVPVDLSTIDVEKYIDECIEYFNNSDILEGVIFYVD